MLGYVCVVLLPPYVNVRTLSPTDTSPLTCLKQEHGFCVRLQKNRFLSDGPVRRCINLVRVRFKVCVSRTVCTNRYGLTAFCHLRRILGLPPSTHLHYKIIVIIDFLGYWPLIKFILFVR